MSANNPAATAASGNVVKVGTKQCKPFSFEVMVYTPEAGYKAQIVVERGCTPTNDSIWKFVFDLYKKQATGTGFDQLVHVSCRASGCRESPLRPDAGRAVYRLARQ